MGYSVIEERGLHLYMDLFYVLLPNSLSRRASSDWSIVNTYENKVRVAAVRSTSGENGDLYQGILVALLSPVNWSFVNSP